MQLPDEAAIGQTLHARFIGGDRIVSDQIFIRYYQFLIDHVTRYSRRKNLYSVDDQMIEDAVAEALGNYLTGSDNYDPTRGKTLGGFLLMSAQRDLLNLFSKKRPPEGMTIVGLDDELRNTLADNEAEFSHNLGEKLQMETWRRQVLDMMENEEERIVLKLMLAGERSTVVFAEALGWLNPTDTAHTKPINRIKDRLSKRLKRRFTAGATNE